MLGAVLCSDVCEKVAEILFLTWTRLHNGCGVGRVQVYRQQDCIYVYTCTPSTAYRCVHVYTAIPDCIALLQHSLLLQYFSLDEYYNSFAIPTHINVDVIGLENSPAIKI